MNEPFAVSLCIHLYLDMHGLILKQAYDYWQDQPDYYLNCDPTEPTRGQTRRKTTRIDFIKVTLIIEYRKATILRALVPNANRIVFEIN